jgi:hypothetical protein
MEGEARGVFEVWWDGGRPKLGEPGNEGGAFMRWFVECSRRYTNHNH